MVQKTPPASGGSFICARGLGLKLPRGQAYLDVDLDIERGEFCSIVANGGEGKTELLLTLAGRMKQTHGTLTVAGYPLPRKRSRVQRISGMGFFEHVNDVQPVLTVASVVAAELNLYSKRSGRRAVREFLEAGGFEDIARRKIESLDRVSYVNLGIALGLVGAPQLLVVDDVESELTRSQSISIMEGLRRIARECGVTVVVACADYDLAVAADRAVPISPSARRQADEARPGADAGTAGVGRPSACDVQAGLIEGEMKSKDQVESYSYALRTAQVDGDIELLGERQSEEDQTTAAEVTAHA